MKTRKLNRQMAPCAVCGRPADRYGFVNNQSSYDMMCSPCFRKEDEKVQHERLARFRDVEVKALVGKAMKTGIATTGGVLQVGRQPGG